MFKLKENIENFIAAISEYGMPRHKLFSVNDLFEGVSILFLFSLICIFVRSHSLIRDSRFIPFFAFLLIIN